MLWSFVYSSTWRLLSSCRLAGIGIWCSKAESNDCRLVIAVIDEEVSKAAASANAAFYDSENTRDYLKTAPHHKHPTLRNLYTELIGEAYGAALSFSKPRILDIGAGEGSATLPFLELGGDVTAVDISADMMAVLRLRCQEYGQHLDTICEDIFDTLESLRVQKRQYDIAVAVSFLHHVPDYMGMILALAPLLSEHGQFFSFQDPLRFDTVGRMTKAFGNFSHYSWRVFQGDVTGGIMRHMRRKRGPDPDNPDDNTEYHYFRNGVDQEAIQRQFEEMGFDCRVVPYFSTQSRIGQRVGEALGLKCNFAILAGRRAP
jgi:2-polyprenyl-3-methyl-5-hydroxy-6-metoxy-1,4-benzoquinol methylase